ncbi:AB hydrolase superfamily protein [Lachnellula occidentalis]|uniref:AB hydrolase superfamily protein n=1 Tax=Lachnellula occidentalis TaxID=215460 RepID=A0A8H8RYT0_9HELO|nr:AB hydrolase superfamily protein [Lachnellula occidentalis]
MGLSIHQPIHPLMRPRLDPQYLAFHEKHFQHLPTIESQAWDPACRNAAAASTLGRAGCVEVGSVRDVVVESEMGCGNGGCIEMRVFTPRGDAPGEGWPVLGIAVSDLMITVYGTGGWVVGGLDSENAFLTLVCRDVKCVVISLNYRHAPEHPYPAAVDDVVYGLSWIARYGNRELGVDTTRIVLGGLSAGGGLATILVMKASLLTPPIPIIGQLLILPVIDNTAGTSLSTTTTSSSLTTSESNSNPNPSDPWLLNQHAPFLTPQRMLWYRSHYLPNPTHATSWTASPNFAPSALLAACPRTVIAVGECDLLAEEARRYGELLRREGVACEVMEYRGATHSTLILAGALDIGKQMVGDMVESLKEMFAM